MFSHAEMAMGRPYDLPYSVELWDDADSHVEELIALTGDYRVARAAFDEAVKRRPGRIVTLRQKTACSRIAGENIRAPTEGDARWAYREIETPSAPSQRKGRYNPLREWVLI
jgi:hypothetical protein